MMKRSIGSGLHAISHMYHHQRHHHHPQEVYTNTQGNNNSSFSYNPIMNPPLSSSVSGPPSPTGVWSSTHQQCSDSPPPDHGPRRGFHRPRGSIPEVGEQAAGGPAGAATTGEGVWGDTSLRLLQATRLHVDAEAVLFRAPRAPLSEEAPWSLHADFRYIISICLKLYGMLAPLTCANQRKIPPGILLTVPLLLVAVDLASPGATTKSLQLLMLMLPPSHRIVAQHLLQLLSLVASSAARNKMDAHNLALVFAPTLFLSGTFKAQVYIYIYSAPL